MSIQTKNYDPAEAANAEVSLGQGLTLSVGSGAPTIARFKGSLYLNIAGSGAADRMYVNTDGSTTWTNVITAA